MGRREEPRVMPEPAPGTFIALLRGINVGGHHKVPMAELRALCSEIGCRDVRSYIQSGNLAFSAAAEPAALETRLEEELARRFGFAIPVLVRAAADWPGIVRSNPFPDASARDPNLVMLALAKAPPRPDAVERLRAAAEPGERIDRTGDALWIHFGGGVGRSKLTPALLDRAAGSPVTMRNWRTVLQLAAMVEPAP